MKKRDVLLFGIITVFSILMFIFFVAAIPSLEFIFQSPPDINTENLYSTGLNVSYNITDIAGINATAALFYFKTNSSINDIMRYVNGTPFSGYIPLAGTNISSNWTFSLDDNDVYPFIGNLNQDVMENAVHKRGSLLANNGVKIEFLNMSNNTEYNIFEFMANSTATASSLFVFYCNSSYTSGSIATNINCVQFGSIAGTSNFNVTNTELNNSKYQRLALTINTTNGKASNAVQITPTSYFILDKIGGSATPWFFYNISINSRTNAFATSTNNGGAWTVRPYTVDAHLHQYSGTNTVYYYACANNTLGENNCSLLRSDLLQQAGMPPSSPHVYVPENNYYSGNINISYIAAISPNGYSISFYNITLANQDESYNKTIATNNSLNLSYMWDSIGTTDGSYFVKVVATDNLSQTSFDFSENFTIDNTNPTAGLTCSSESVHVGNIIDCSCSGTDATSGVSTIDYTKNPPTGSSGTFSTICTVTDFAGNSATDSFTYTVTSGGTISGSSGGASSLSTPSINPSENTTTILNSIINKNETIAVYVENKTYNLTILNIENNSVKTIFSYDSIERTISVGEEVNYTVGENIVTIKLKAIEKEGAIFDVTVNKKSSPVQSDNSPIIIAIIIILVLLIFVTLFRKHKKISEPAKEKNNFIKKFVKKMFKAKQYLSKSAENEIYKKVHEAERLKKRAKELLKEAKIKKKNAVREESIKKLKEAQIFKRKYKQLTKEAHHLCRKCKVNYNKFK